MRDSPALRSAWVVVLFLYAASLPVSLAVSNAGAALLLAFAVLWLRRDRWECPCSFLVLLLFFAWAGLTVWISDGYPSLEGLKSFSKSWNFVPYLALPVGAAAAGTERRLLRSLGVAALVAVLVIALGAVEYATGLHYFFEGWFGTGPMVDLMRLRGFQSHPLHTAGLYTVLLMATLAVALFHRGGRPGTRFWAFCSAGLAFGVLLTGSRSYYLASAAGCGALLLARSRKLFLISAFAAILALVVLTQFNLFISRRFESINPEHMDETGRQRIYLWRSAALMIRDHPFAGVGYRKWRENITAYAQLFPSWGQKDPAIYAHAHDSYLTVGAETGLPGLMLFLGFWFCLFKEGWERLRRAPPGSLSSALALGQSAAILSLLCAAFFEHNLFTADVTLTLSFAIGLSAAADGLAEAGK